MPSPPALPGPNTVLAADPLGTTIGSGAASVAVGRASGSGSNGSCRCLAMHKTVKSSLEAIGRQVAGHRAKGLKLIEEGANPDLLLGPGRGGSCRDAQRTRAGDPDAAGEKLDAAKSAAQEALATIEKVQKAGRFASGICRPARERPSGCAAALPQAESYQNDLEREFARSSWQAVARNLDQARALLATFDRQAEQAAPAATTTRQEYVSGPRSSKSWRASSRSCCG